jgi:hypothetical protein
MTVVASMMATEARHAAWIGSSVMRGSPWNTALENALSIDQVYTLLSTYIKSCPSSNDPRASFNGSPTIDIRFLGSGSSVAPAIPHTTQAGRVNSAVLKFTLPQKFEGKRLLATVIRGTGTVFVPLVAYPEASVEEGQVAMKMDFPNGVNGVAYVVVTTEGKAGNLFRNDNIVAGPGIVRFEFDSQLV